MKIDAALTDQSIVQELGERLGRHRLERNLTQAQLAQAAGIGRATLQRLEAGETAELSTFIRVLRALGRLDALDRLVPEPAPSPVQLLKLQGRKRARARQPAHVSPAAERAPWRWGDEA
jgi:transcriptional regulator with XRE-family HTH domain